MIGLPCGEKNYDDNLSRFHTIPACHGQTDGRTDRIGISVSRVSSRMLTRDKNWKENEKLVCCSQKLANCCAAGQRWMLIIIIYYYQYDFFIFRINSSPFPTTDWLPVLSTFTDARYQQHWHCVGELCLSTDCNHDDENDASNNNLQCCLDSDVEACNL